MLACLALRTLGASCEFHGIHSASDVNHGNYGIVVDLAHCSRTQMVTNNALNVSMSTVKIQTHRPSTYADPDCVPGRRGCVIGCWSPPVRMLCASRATLWPFPATSTR